MKKLEMVISSLSEEEKNINLDYAEIAACDGIDPGGFFILDSDGSARWISLVG